MCPGTFQKSDRCSTRQGLGNQCTSCNMKAGMDHRGTSKRGKAQPTQNLNHLKTNAYQMHATPFCDFVLSRFGLQALFSVQHVYKGRISHGRDESFFQLGVMWTWPCSARRGIVDLRRDNITKVSRISSPFLPTNAAG